MLPEMNPAITAESDRDPGCRYSIRVMVGFTD